MCLCWLYAPIGGRRFTRVGRRDGVDAKPIGAASLPGWPPFTACWHPWYIKETPPTAAPDNFQHWRRHNQESTAERWAAKRHPGPASYLHHFWEGRGTVHWGCVEFTAFLLPMSFLSSERSFTDIHTPRSLLTSDVIQVLVLLGFGCRSAYVFPTTCTWLGSRCLSQTPWSRTTFAY